MKQKEIRVLMVKPGEHPREVTIRNDLDSLQKAVSIGSSHQGLIEIIGIDDRVCILCNEEGKLIGLKGNRRVGSDIIAGVFYVVGEDGFGNLKSLPDDEMKKYSILFWEPEFFSDEAVADAIDVYFLEGWLSSDIPTREGYWFLGWSTTSSGEVEYPEGSIYEEDASVVLFAVWSKIKYTVSFDANGGTGAPEDQTKMHGETLVLSDTEPEREGYTFLGWSTAKDGEVEYSAGNTYSTDISIVLYAVWQENANVVASGECGEDLTWTLYDNGLLHISGTGAMYDWEACEAPWWSYRSQIAIVEIEEGCTTIGSHAFAILSGMTPYEITIVKLPSTLNSINFRAFYLCASLTEISIPNPNCVEIIDDYAFYECTNLQEMPLCENLKSIGFYAFTGCKSLGNIVLNSKLEILGWYAFSACDSVEFIEIQENLKTIGIGAFNSCDNLKNMTVHPDNPYFANDDNGVLYDMVNHILLQYPNGSLTTSYVIDNTTVEIARSAFSSCYNLQEVYLPKSLSIIDAYNFANGVHQQIQTMYYAGTSIEWDANITVKAPDSSGLYAAMSYDVIFNNGAEEYVVTYNKNGSNDLASIPSQIKVHDVDLTLTTEKFTRTGYTFKGWATSIDGDVEYSPGGTYSANASTVLYAVWESTQNSTSILASGTCGDNLAWEISNSGVLTISGAGDMMDFGQCEAPWYTYCSSILSVRIENDVTSIGAYAFYNCTALADVMISNSVASIGFGAFENCTGLPGISLPDSVTELVGQTFSGCSSLVYVTLPSNITQISSYVFCWCESLTSITIPNSVTNIGEAAFAGCSSLTSIYLPEKIIAIGDYAFNHCSNLTGIWVSEDNTVYSSDSYGVLYNKDRTKLRKMPNGYCGSYSIPDGVTQIQSEALANCSNLTSITIPASLNQIGFSAFYGCSNLSDVYFCGTKEQWSAISIADDNAALTEAYLHTVENTLGFTGASLALHHNLTINYKADKALFESYCYSSPYVVFEFNGEKKTVDTYTIEDNRYVFTFCDIAPNQMNDSIYATLYATYDGTEYSSEPREYSVATYCYNMLEKCSSDEYAEFRTLLVDLLHYGAASQIYTDYNTAALVDAQLTDTQLAWGTNTDRTFETLLDPTYQQVETPNVSWKGAGLNLQDSVTMRLKFTTESIDGLTLRIESDVGFWTIASEEFVQTDDGYYAFFNGLNAGQMSEAVYMTFYDGDTPVSNTARYSIESYAFSNQNMPKIYATCAPTTM